MSRETGFSMIEVLVALVLISIGVLGMVAMQGRTIQYTQESVQRNAAAMLASDLMEIMRADPDAVLNLRAQLREDSVYYKAKGSDFPAAQRAARHCQQMLRNVSAAGPNRPRKTCREPPHS